MRACEYRTGEGTEQARAPMYNRNAVRLYLGISRKQLPVYASPQAISDAYNELALGQGNAG